MVYKITIAKKTKAILNVKTKILNPFFIFELIKFKGKFSVFSNKETVQCTLLKKSSVQVHFFFSDNLSPKITTPKVQA
jgi:hypothetical protein